MRKAKINKKIGSEVAKTKDRIQALCRAIVIKRDEGCIFRDYPESGACGGIRSDGELILQFDHLNSRAYSVSYGDTRLGVCVCKRHHIFWKRQHPDEYMRIARQHIGTKRSVLLDRVIADRKPYHVDLWDWAKVEIALIDELEDYEV